MRPDRKTAGFVLVSLVIAVASPLLAYWHVKGAAIVAVLIVLAAGAGLAWLLGVAEGLVVLLIVTSFVDRYTFPAGSVNVRPEQIAALVATAVLVALRVRDHDLRRMRPNLAEAALLAWFAVGLVSSLVESPIRGQSIKILGLLVVSSLALFVPWRLIDEDAARLERVVRWVLLAFALECLFATLAYFAHVLGPTISMSVNSAGGHLNEYGTLWEPNTLGAVAGAGAVVWAVLGPPRFRHAWLGTAICLAACAISYARASWLAVVIVLTIAIATPISRRINTRALWMAEAATVVVVVLMIAAESIASYTVGPQGGLSGALGAVGNGADLAGRLRQISPVLHDLKHSPLIGGGIDSFGQRHMVQGVQDHLANLEFTVLNDTGLIGLLLFGAFVVLVGMAAWRHRDDPVVFGLSGMLLVIGIANQATQTTELMITWLLMGLLLAALRPGTSRTARDSGP